MRQAITDALREEMHRDENEQSPGWIERQKAVMGRALDALENEVEELAGGPLTIGQIAVACSLGWTNFRFPDDKIFETCPKLTAWFESFSARPSMKETEPKE